MVSVWSVSPSYNLSTSFYGLAERLGRTGRRAGSAVISVCRESAVPDFPVANFRIPRLGANPESEH